MKIIFIIPYFGKFPQWFPMFLGSIKNIKSADFLIFTDDQENFSYPSNTKVVYTTFNAIQDMFKEKTGKNLYIGVPYKLIDYKPLFGHVFQEYITNYSYWGHCDLDLLFGDFDGILQKYHFFEEDYDRFSRAGHLTIYKNSPYINNFYTSKIRKYNHYYGFEFAIKTSYPIHFDELGMNILSYQNNLKYFDKILYGHVQPEFEVMTVQYTDRPEILYRYKGQVLASYLNLDGTIETIDLLYLHIMRRGVLPMYVSGDEDYYITHSGFYPFEIEKLKNYLVEFGTKVNPHQEQYSKVFKKSVRRKSFQKVLQECRAFPFTGIKNIFIRYFALKTIKKVKY